ncbi:MAG: hypothetical protein OMM_10390, partial [Candidatus Magnetoglobus multicellularis str. Araruama]
MAKYYEVSNIELLGVSGASVAFGDYDNDGDLDILLTGYPGSGYIAKVYRNTDGSFSQNPSINIGGTSRGSVAFGDYDNDGDLDILISGYTFSGVKARVYKNENNYFNLNTEIILYQDLAWIGDRSPATFGDYDNDGDLDIITSGSSGLAHITKLYQNIDSSFSEDTSFVYLNNHSSTLDSGDYDNDGDLDILITGSSHSSKVYQNTGGSFNENTEINLTGVYFSAAAFGDYDSDGDIDILLSGTTGNTKITKIYKNTGGAFSENTDIDLPGVSFNSVAFGDYDNDGDLDILIAGYSDNGRIAKMYQNTGTNFIEDTGIKLTGISDGSVAFGDYDNDNDLDILIVGDSDNGYIAKLYRNNSDIQNTPPSAPLQLTSVVTGKNVKFSWSAGSDSQTIREGLNYNLRIGSSPGACDILSPMSLPLSSGYRQIPERGAFQSLTTTININEPGTYYWSVQAIDTVFSGSPFSEEYSFTIFDVAPIPGNNGLISSTTLIPSSDKIIFSWSFATD